MPQDGVPPNSRPNPPRPVADDWKPAAIERVALLKRRAAELGIAVAGLPTQGRTRQMIEDWCDDLGRRLLAGEEARNGVAAAHAESALPLDAIGDRLRAIAAKGPRRGDASEEDQAWFKALPDRLQAEAERAGVTLPPLDRETVKTWAQGLEWAAGALDALRPF